ncbi:hypothetical protein HPB48_021297 [Haemaphysalis longicornis]|uniref:Uncharacterized protein n=1 Tax=Haemaphysalis longicornis TaxID=44386 RepID=A0A9J6FMJ4_HAELO|nr:hypothetical protein HPB48_021297 [Haemaphysalis longicornis]
MAAASRATENAPARVYFSVSTDLSLLRDVQASDPFRDPAQWTRIAERLSSDTGKPFAARAVRDRCQNLMALYAANDRKNLRKSGTEEEYNERDHILQDLICLADGTNFTFKVRAHRRAPTAPRGPRSAAATRRAAEAVRNDAADSIGLLSPLEEEDENSSSGIETARKKDLEVDHEFLLKRMKHEAEMQRREHAIESRRLALEESRLEWEKQRTLLEQQARDEERRRQLEREEEERRARAEERRTYAAQQQAFLNILEGILSRLNQ